MKKFIYFIAAILLLQVNFSCSEEKIDVYSGDDAIYFDQQYGVAWFDTIRQSRQNYSLVKFGNMDERDSLLTINVAVTGYVRDYDRPFGVEFVADSTSAINGDEFEILTPNPVIAAGQNSAKIKVRMHCTDRMDSTTVQLQLRLIPGEHFTSIFDETGIGVNPHRERGGGVYTEFGTNYDPMIHNIFANCELQHPGYWAPYLGDFSPLKLKLLIEVVGAKFGWKPSDFEKGYDFMFPRLSIMYTNLGKYLLEQYNKGPEYWVADPDGTFMWIKYAPLETVISENDKIADRVDLWYEQHPKN